MVYNSFQNSFNLTGAKVISLLFIFLKHFSRESATEPPASTSKRVLVIKILGSFCSTFLSIFSTYYENNTLLKIKKKQLSVFPQEKFIVGHLTLHFLSQDPLIDMNWRWVQWEKEKKKER